MMGIPPGASLSLQQKATISDISTKLAIGTPKQKKPLAFLTSCNFENRDPLVLWKSVPQQALGV